MFLDITALKDYMDISNIQKLSMNIEMEKVILLLDNNLMADKAYLSKVDPSTGEVTISLEAPNNLYNNILQDIIKIDVKNKAELLSLLKAFLFS